VYEIASLRLYYSLTDTFKGPNAITPDVLPPKRGKFGCESSFAVETRCVFLARRSVNDPVNVALATVTLIVRIEPVLQAEFVAINITRTTAALRYSAQAVGERHRELYTQHGNSLSWCNRYKT
jgi:hypothetical protein